MLRRYVIAGAFAMACAGAGAAAQTPAGSGQQPQDPDQPRTTPQSESREATPQRQTTTLTGCVYAEKDVPGRSPNVAERAGILEDYILADVKASGKEAQPGAPQATGTSGTSAMYKLEHADDEKLSALVGKRVEVTGRIDAEAGDTKSTPTGTTGATPDRSAGPDQIELPEFEVTSIRETSGDCPATPGAGDK